MSVILIKFNVAFRTASDMSTEDHVMSRIVKSAEKGKGYKAHIPLETGFALGTKRK